MQTSESLKELATALAQAQREMGSAAKGADNPFFKSKYADLAEVVKAIKEPLANNGLSYTQFPITEGESAGVITWLMHDSGEWMKSEYTLPLSKFDAQSVGSCITYARRYALQAIAGIPAGDDDGNDANKAAPKAKAKKPMVPEASVSAAIERLGEGKGSVEELLAHWQTRYQVSDDLKKLLKAAVPEVIE